MAENAVKDWKDLKGISQDDFNKRFDTGEFDDFMEDKSFFEAQNDGSLFQKAEEAPIVEPEKKPEPEATIAPPDDKGEPKLWWQEQGYESEQEGIEKAKNLRDLLAKKQSQIDRFNAERGDVVGKTKAELEQARKEKLALQDELKKLRESGASSPPVVNAPRMPISPIPEDGDYGGEAFREKYKKYQAEVEDYNNKSAEFAKYVSEVRAENATIKSTVDEYGNSVKTVVKSQTDLDQANAVKRAGEEWSGLMNQVKVLQEHDPILKTSKSFDEINDFVRKSGMEEAAAIYSKVDIDNYNTLVNVIKDYHNFDEKGNLYVNSKPKYKSIKSAWMDHIQETGKFDEYIARIKNGAAKEGREQVIEAIDQQRNSATTLPVGSDLKDNVEQLTAEQRRDLLAKYSGKEYDARIEEDSIFRKEVYTLMKQEPGYEAAIPTAWIEEFETKKE